MPEGEANGRTWIKVDTDLLLGTNVDDKLAGTELDRAQLALAYLALIAWSRRKLTDGLIPKNQAPGIIARACRLNRSEAEVRLSELAVTGMVKTDRHRIKVPDYAEWQQTADDVKALAERQSAAGKASARKRATGSTTGRPPVHQRSTEQSREEKSSKAEASREKEASRAHETGALPKLPAIENGETTATAAELANTAIRTDPIGRLMAAIGTSADRNTEQTITSIIERNRLSQAAIERCREAVEASSSRDRARYAVGTLKRIAADVPT